GVRLSIDDFGTGYSSLVHLNDLPVDELKIDRRFVQNLLTGRRSAALARGVLDLGRALGLTVVAEGVEDATILHALADLHREYAQGFHLAHPMPASDLERWMDGQPSAAPAPLSPESANR